ncbi:MAG: ABC transporter ATP-binding protein, partial [Bacteroidetes bacterium]
PLKRAARKGQAVLGELASMVDEFAGGARVVKAFQKEAFERDRYARKNKEYNKLQVSVARRSELASPLTEIISVAIVCLILYAGGTLILDEKSALKASEFLGFIAVFSQVLAPVKVLTAAFSKIQRGTAAFSRIEEILNTQPKIQNRPDALDIDGFTKEVRFEGVFFSYDSTEVLHNIHFSLPKGATVALVGPSGGGKSTLADLIPRFYDPSQGAIYLDGRDLRDISVESLRACIGVVSQEGILFHDTVWSNIAYGIPDTDPEAVVEAAKIANAHEFIMELPDQYQTVIGERGSMLSGGQRQRIAIARAVLRNPSILILDEATSNLDTQSEKLVQDALEKLMAQRTSLVIAHRLSTILHADQILVIERGRIIEQGTHEELYQKGGRYRELYAVQFES